MDPSLIFDSWAFTWIVLPILIFCARICDVSIGTLRVVFISRGNKYIAPIMGFFEVIIWLVAIGQIMKHLTNVMCYVAYGGGFAAGTYLGMWIVDRLSMGSSLVRVITSRDTSQLEERLRAMGYGVTTVEAVGKEGDTTMLHTVIRNQDLKVVLDLVEQFNPRAFYTVEDIRSAGKGKFPGKRSAFSQVNLEMFRPHRKGK
jgi:uncharacterized protein YebE (UPF0316 family)